MAELWLLRGKFDAPGWKDLERDAKEDKVEWVLFDRDAFAILNTEQAPEYEGFTATVPPDGLYVDQQGNSVGIVGRKRVKRDVDVIKALGPEAVKLLEELRDPVAVLQRLGKAY
jgi:hypothetical protein